MEATTAQDPFLIEQVSVGDETAPETDAVICRLAPPDSGDLFDTES